MYNPCYDVVFSDSIIKKNFISKTPELTNSGVFVLLFGQQHKATFATLNLPTLIDKDWVVNYNTDSIILSVQNSLSTTDSQGKNKTVLYPVPFTDFLNIKSNSLITKLKIFDATGKEVLSEFNKNLINTSSLSVGFYFIKIEELYGNVEIKKIVKK